MGAGRCVAVEAEEGTLPVTDMFVCIAPAHDDVVNSGEVPMTFFML